MAPVSLIGQVVSVAITGTGTNTLFGDVVEQHNAPAFAAAGA
jgi:hypothetical protein